ncbi:hypothetical protein A2U94_09755 [Bacillus sp. VT 712]|uniref:hypothetical protein n=1 Tax=Bacillaceae TaxID=186817 RepID=UPI000473F35C|nr:MULTISPECIES: hypothetical protein [Bacillaceae]KZB91757.1 hypothetical protein A2U94_09755 [Bacillus sp. VT 712]
MNKKVFLTADHEGLPSQSIQQMDVTEAMHLEASGKAIPVSLSNLDEIENAIERLVADYRKKYDAMTKSEDPVYKVEGAIDYYSKQMKAELETEVAALNSKYEAIVASTKESAMRDLANKRRYISEDERKAARDVVTETIASIKFGNTGVIDTLIEQAPYMTDSRKLALLQEVGRITEATNDSAVVKKARSLYMELDAVKSGELLPVKIAQALPDSADLPLKHLKMTHPTYRGTK